MSNQSQIITFSAAVTTLFTLRLRAFKARLGGQHAAQSNHCDKRLRV
jgi:hypothetical protein